MLWVACFGPVSAAAGLAAVVHGRHLRLGVRRCRCRSRSIVYAGSGIVSPILVGFPLLIAASGLWFRVRLVVFMTVLSIAAYLAAAGRSALQPGPLRADPDRPVRAIPT